MNIPSALASLRTLDRHVAWSTIVQLGGKVLQIALAAGTLKLSATALTRADQGLASGVTEFALFVAALANFGFFANVVRRASTGSDTAQIVGHALVLRLATGLGCSLLALGGLALWGTSSVFLVSTALFLAALLFDQVTSVCDGLLQARYKMGRATFALLLGKLLTFALTVVVVARGPSGLEMLPLLFASILAGGIATALVSLAFVRGETRIDLRLDRRMTRMILITSIPFGIITVLNMLTFRFLPDLLASQVLDDAVFATFCLSFRIAQVLSLASTVLMFSVLPQLRRALVERPRPPPRKLVRGATLALVGAGAALVIVGSLAGPWLLATFTHAKYVDATLPYLLPGMLLLAAVSYLYDLALISLFALDDERWWIPRETLGLLVALCVSALLLLPLSMPEKLGVIIGAAVAGESTVVVLGLRRLRARLHDGAHQPIHQQT